jgi:hypothetical protein
MIPEAIVTLTEETYIVGIWMFPVPASIHPPLGGDVMAILYKEKATDPNFKLMHRHSYHADKVVRFGNTKDRKSAYHWEMKGGKTEDELQKNVHQSFGVLALAAGNDFAYVFGPEFYFNIRGGIEKAYEMAKAGKAPRWFNLQMVSSTPPVDPGPQTT